MSKYKWIYSKTNFLNKVDVIKLKKFFYSTYNFELGWEPAAKSMKKEYLKNKEIGNIKFDEHRRRYDPNQKLRKSDYVIFGDSYALSRQVNECETIAHLLGKISNQFFPNYGVGNYGLDQAYLRYLKYKHLLKDKHIIFIVVPETIVRINTRWRHFHETGNIFGFKPKFSINEKNKLFIEENPIKKFADYETIFNDFINRKSNLINDLIYKYRFKQEAINLENLIKFKFDTISKLFEYLEWIFKRNYLNKIGDEEGLTIRMKSNAAFTNKCYLIKNTQILFEKLVLEMKKETNNNMSIFVIPQLSDLKKNNLKRKNFFNRLTTQNSIKIFDATNFLIKEMGSFDNTELLYVEKGYGGHLTKEGNLLIAKWIKELIL